MPVAIKERPSGNQLKDEKMKPSPSDNRVHITFPEGMRKRLEEMRSEAELSSVSEVFREAVKFYMLAYEEHKKGSDFLIRNKDGQLERLRMFM